MSDTDPSDSLPSPSPDDERPMEPATEPLTLKGSFGTAMGAAMLGFEQALRKEPPAEILAAEHAPERGHSGADGRFVIEFPDEADLVRMGAGDGRSAPPPPATAETGHVIEQEVAGEHDQQQHGQDQEHGEVHR